MPGSLFVLHYETTTGEYKVQRVGSSQISDLAIVSGKIASGAIGISDLLADQIVTSAKLTSAVVSLLGTVSDGAIISSKLASGIVGSVHLADQAVASGDIGANIIATPHIANQGLLSSVFGANVIATPHIANQGILSASIGAGVIGHSLVTDYGIISGKVSSGAITETALASGISIDISEVLQEPTYRAQDLISAYLAIQFNVSGYFNYARAGDVSSMPAVGVAIANIASGQIGTFQYQGRLTNTSWDFSGYVGRMLFVGTSSEVTRMASGLMVSGISVQRLAKVVDASTIFIKPELIFAQISE